MSDISASQYFKNNKLDMAINTGMIITDIAQGKGVVKSVAKGAVDFALWDVIGGALGGTAMLGLFGIQMADMGMSAALEHGYNNVDLLKRNVTGPGRVGGGFQNESQYSATMRERSLQSMGGNQGLVRQALGSEARRRSAYANY